MKNNRPAILLIDDERGTREVLGKFLRLDYQVTLAEDGVAGLKALEQQHFDLVLTDIQMPGADGFRVLEKTLALENPPPCIMLTAYGSIETAVDAMRKGAFDFVAKPVNFDRLELVIRKALETKQIKEENVELKKRLNDKFGVSSIVGASEGIRRVIDMVRQVAPTRATVLIEGESGTGKELIAQSLHQLSGRKGKFMPIHCAALPETLLESELFGHEKG
ncbi:MAG: sigma-54-dependent Fis family transcriptional regulator, partial [Lentisphaeria bacterium]|nr:sigma-54-dependent Fis family transcriptional regulator [Lentisphaeria bacterium]